mgnify:CR=1 FL=1
MIQLSGVTKDYPSPSGERLRVLDDVTFQLEAGASLAIQGPSGSGKSTLLGILAGLEQPTAGRVAIHGTELKGRSERELAAFRARHLGFVFQAFHLIPHFSALQNVVIGAEIAGVADAAAKARESLARVGLEDRLHHTPGQLSGGECQRVAIARATVTRPKVLLCDEPTGSLDAAHAGRVFDLLMELHRDLGTTLVLVTHDPALASRMEGQLRLQGGRVVSE